MANKIVTVEYTTEAEREQYIIHHETLGEKLLADRIIFSKKTLDFEDLSQERYIKSLEDQLLLMADAAAGGIL